MNPDIEEAIMVDRTWATCAAPAGCDLDDEAGWAGPPPDTKPGRRDLAAAGGGASRSRGVPAVFWRLALAMTASRLGLFVVPFLAYYLARGRGLDAGPLAVVMTGFGCGWAAGPPIAGRVADRFGNRPVIIAGCLAAALAYLGMGSARSVPAMTAWAWAVGLAFDSWRPAAMALLSAEAGTEEQRKRAFTYLYWAMNAGAVVAALGAGVLAVTAGWPWLFRGNAIACAAFAVAARLLIQGHRNRRAAKPPWDRARAPVDWLLLSFTALTVLALAIESQEMYALPLRFAGDGIGPLSYGVIVAVNPFACVVVQPLLQRWLISLPAMWTCAAGMLLTGVGIALTGEGSGLAWFATVSVIWIVGEVALIGPGGSVVTSLAPAGMEAGYAGTWNLAPGLASVIAVVAGSALVRAGGLQLLWQACAAGGVLAAILCALLAGPVAARLRQHSMERGEAL